MEPMQGYSIHCVGGNKPSVKGNIYATNVNLGIQGGASIQGENREPNKRKRKEEQDDEIAGFIENIEDYLVDINDFIEIAEQSPIKNPKLMKLLEKLKDAAYDAQDLLEEYKIADRRRSDETANSMPVPDTMRKNLEKVSKRLKAIKKKARAFKLEKVVTNLQIEFQEDRKSHSLVHKSKVFEREEETEQIVNWLLSNRAGDRENVSVISIVGIGGIGKTTLAKLVFDHKRVQNAFEPRMWICVSYDFDVIRLGNEIIERATRHNPNLSNVEELQRRLGETLSEKKFLLVLDDVWNEDHKKWDRLRELLLCGRRGSRIVVTTRIPKVAFIMSKIQPHILKPLSENSCWSLLCLSAFGNQAKEVEAAHPNLAPIGRQIVEKCKGNPLAVTIVGGLLRSESSQDKWENVRKSIIWNLDDENENGILPALRLSYIHLKPHLKQCFAFCAIFPQDYVIEKELVIKLWMAHGFIPTERRKELVESGNEIFYELVMRYFFQDVKENVKIYKRAGPYSGVYIPDQTTFRMHDLMHDLAHSVMENEYHVVLNGKVLNSKSEDISPRICHISSNGLGNLADSLPKAKKLRTYVMLRNANFQFPCEVGPFKCLRALDFVGQRDKQKVENSQLLTSLGNLQHLRYLNLSFTSIEMLPESLTTLCYLQTLILIRCTKLCELPKETSRLINLRCLDITGCGKLTHMPPKMGQLSRLQELSNFIVGRTNEITCSGIGELQSLNHLRGSLRIKLLKNITDANAMDVPQDTLINKPNLTSLYLMWEDPMDVVEKLEKQVLQGLQPDHNLKKLEIFGPNFPNWMMDTTRTALVEITLSRCWRCKHLPPLGELPSLKVLVIEELKNVECVGNEFYGNKVSVGFPSLKVLHIGHMKKLKTWSGLEWKGKRAFPSLVKLELRDCRMLSTLKFFPDIKDVNVDQGVMQSLKNQKSFEPMHQQNCKHSSFADEDKIRSQSSLQELVIQSCCKLNFSSLGHRCFSSLKTLTIINSDEFAHVAHELSFLTSLEVLRLDSCYGLSRLPEGIGNLTSLQDLVLRNCRKLESLPRELQRLTSLKRLSIYRCHPCLKTRCTKDTGDDWDKIQHIHDIIFEVNHIARY